MIATLLVQFSISLALESDSQRWCERKFGRNANCDSGWFACPGRAFDGACRPVGSRRNASVEMCEAACLKTARCTAINYGHGSCSLRACPEGTPPGWLLHGETGYANYHIQCDAPSPPPSPLPPPSPRPPPNFNGSQVHLSLGWPQPNTYIVTWSTNESLAGHGGSMAEIIAAPNGTTKHVAGTESIFIDNGTLRHTQFIHRAAFTNLAHGQQYSYRVARGGLGCGFSQNFNFVALFPSKDEHASFTVFGDMGWWNDRIYPQLVADAVKRDTDVVIHNGDIACRSFSFHRF